MATTNSRATYHGAVQNSDQLYIDTTAERHLPERGEKKHRQQSGGRFLEMGVSYLVFF